MKTLKLNPGKQVRMFESDFLEKFSYVHPFVPASFWVPVVLIAFILSMKTDGGLSFLTAALVATAGLVFWSFAEYVLHRFIFHLEIDTKLGKRIHFLIHGIHHEDPNDQRRILMPLAPAILIAIGFYFLFSAVMSQPLTLAFFSGFIVGYLIYDYSHFAFHYVRPKSGWLYRMKDYHMKHHFVTPHARFGVSSQFWDTVFGTFVKSNPSPSNTYPN